VIRNNLKKYTHPKMDFFGVVLCEVCDNNGDLCCIHCDIDLMCSECAKKYIPIFFKNEDELKNAIAESKRRRGALCEIDFSKCPVHVKGNCFKCKKWGHYANQCPRGASNCKVICRKCKNVGHYANQCNN
jgi:hypothetical protein